jgi:hypothetical protein
MNLNNSLTSGMLMYKKPALVKGMTWVAMGVGIPSNEVIAISAVDNSNVYVGGFFTDIGGDTNKNRIAKWNGTTWQRMGSGIADPGTDISAIYAIDNSNVYVGGGFANIGGDIFKRRIARWDGATWQRMSSGMNAGVLTIYAVDNSNVYVGGNFTTAGGVSATYIARWDGATWRAMGTGTNAVVSSLSAVNNSNVYVGGNFTSAGGVANTVRIARWNGASWNAMGTGTNAQVYATASVDNSNVYVGGNFTTAGGVSVSYTARWDGATWRAMGSGITDVVTTISARNNTNVYVGGFFPSIGGDTKKQVVAKWDGTTWQRMGSGISSGGGGYWLNTIYAIDNANVYVGGNFIDTDIGGGIIPKQVNIAKWTNNY